MKVLIISDIHDDFDSLKIAIQNHSFDYLILLGDIGYYNDRVFDLLNVFSGQIVSVKGNNDFYNSINFKNDEYYKTITIDDKVWFLTHGHVYNRNRLPNVDFDIYLQGHTHKSMMELDNGKLYLNPGSISLPRDGVKSYIYYEDNTFYLETLDKIIIKKVSI